MNIKRINIFEATPNDQVLSILLSMSKEWEKEQNVYGYIANEKSDIEGSRIFLAYDDDYAIGYLLGRGYCSKKMKSVIEEGSPCFEIEELYVIASYRSKGVGKELLDKVCVMIQKEYQYITLTTATKNHRAILNFYIEEVGMNFWSARLFKKL